MSQDTKQKPMSKTQLASHLAEKFELPRKTVVELLDEIADLAYTQTATTGEFSIPGVGKLIKQERAARTGRNPATGQPIEIAAKNVVKFRVAKAAKDAVLTTPKP